jgi:hypothetical protein
MARGTKGANRRFGDNNKRRGGGIHGRWECKPRRRSGSSLASARISAEDYARHLQQFCVNPE